MRNQFGLFSVFVRVEILIAYSRQDRSLGHWFVPPPTLQSLPTRVPDNVAPILCHSDRMRPWAYRRSTLPASRSSSQRPHSSNPTTCDGRTCVGTCTTRISCGSDPCPN